MPALRGEACSGRVVAHNLELSIMHTRNPVAETDLVQAAHRAPADAAPGLDADDVQANHVAGVLAHLCDLDLFAVADLGIRVLGKLLERKGSRGHYTVQQGKVHPLLLNEL